MIDIFMMHLAIQKWYDFAFLWSSFMYFNKVEKYYTVIRMIFVKICNGTEYHLILKQTKAKK